ncbi:GUN4 domain-containing protein [Brasilonema octagenarum]|uniref:GUN4-like domain-containing protein n=1 Tax=Brasilonema octagenarum UFV-OR1 TaxID=417115 RepID=A0ABX1M8U4_9CYAN|nr:GUN4 domain-containing protein [Brasilonema octagenarum]NMF64953.1 hypothetical protein [Brasilonema octagenarum UFV-OR1]
MNANFSESVILITSADPERIADRDRGTGFVIHQDQQTTYLLTCAHVVEAIGGSEKVKVGGHPATVKALGNTLGCDLAVLAVKKHLSGLPPLRLGVVGNKGRQFLTAGFYTDATKVAKLAEIKGKLGGKQRIDSIEGDRTQAWNLLIDDDSEHDLKAGYSGSPVVDLESGYVLGVVSQRIDNGKGVAISIEAIQNIWHSMPYDLLKTDNVISEPRVDYTRLREFLAARKWKQADQETEMLILQLAGQTGNLLNVKSIEKLPCSDLRTIDQLWIKFSEGRFGFSVQKQIWERFGNNTNTEYELYCQFGNHVGWRKHGRWLWYNQMTFDLCAPNGHLPQWGLEAVLLGKTMQWKWNEFQMSQGLGEPVFSKFFDQVHTCNL